MNKTSNKITTKKVNINLDKNLSDVITIIKNRYHLLNDAEIFKLALNEFYLNLQKTTFDEDLNMTSQSATWLNNLDWTPDDATNYKNLKPLSQSNFFGKLQ
jgi:hypothetical protein